MSITYDFQEIDFDEEQWEDLLNSDQILNEQYSNTIDNSKNDIIKLSMNDFTTSNFFNTTKYTHINRSMTILTPPSSNQRVRYENECKHIFRYLSIPHNGTLTIKIPDLRSILIINDVVWMRITRTTVNHPSHNLIFIHPYPIWIKNKNARIHYGSIFIPITNENMDNGFIQIDTLAMIRLKQDELKKINTLALYSHNHLNIFGLHSIEMNTAKRIRDIYQLQQSVLNFQLIRVDQNNVAFPTDCFCQTEILHELEANGQQQKTVEFHQMNIQKSVGATGIVEGGGRRWMRSNTKFRSTIAQTKRKTSSKPKDGPPDRTTVDPFLTKIDETNHIDK